MSTLCLQQYNHNFAIVPDLCERISRKRSRGSPFSLEPTSFEEDLEFVKSLQNTPKREKLSTTFCPSNQAPEFGIFDPNAFSEFFESSNQSNLFGSSSSSSSVVLPPLPSGMQQAHFSSQSNVRQATEPELLVMEQPEEYYRARYGSEGVRAPLKGRRENYPTVQVMGFHGKFTGNVTVKLVHEDGSPHPSCSLDNSEDRKQALSKKINFGNHSVEFEDLRIRREKKKEGRKAAANEKVSAKEGRDDKKACLLFTAILTSDRGDIHLQALSTPISLTTAPEPAELDLVHPSIAHYGAQDLVIIKGSKMTSPKVSFRITLPSGQLQVLHGCVDKERSHQNVLLVKTPSLHHIMEHIGSAPRVSAEVVVTTGRSQMPSNSLMFEFIQNHICRECHQLYPQAASSPHSSLPPTHTAPQQQQQPPTVCSPPPVPTPTINVVLSPIPRQMTDFTDQPSSSVNLSQMVHPETLCHSVFTSDVVGSLTSAISPTGYCSTTANMPSPSIHVPPSTPPTSSGCQGYDSQQQQAEKRNDDSNIMLLVEKLMEESQQQPAMYGGSFGIEQASSNGGGVGSPFLPDVSPTAGSPASDSLCYSPVTPVHSPVDGVWNCIESMLKKMFENGQINQTYFEFWSAQCATQSPVLFSCFASSCNDETLFLQQLLASQKLPLFSSTHQ